MYYRGVVIEQGESFIIVLTDEGEFLKLKVKDGVQVGQTLLFLEEDLLLPNVLEFPTKNRKWIGFMTAVAACLLLWILPQVNLSPVYAVLSVDINPSFELELDENQQIVKVITLNESASLLDGLSLEGMSLQAGLTKIEQILSDANYELSRDAMLFSLSFIKDENQQYEEQVKESLRTADISTDFVYLKVSSDELQQARSHHMSGAKMRVSTLLEEPDASKLSVNEIIKRFNEENLSFDMHCHDGKMIEENKSPMMQGEGCPMH